jgi:RNA polymerase sigma-70 factor (ECF subfamily)
MINENMANSGSSNYESRTGLFFHLFMANYKNIYAFILSLVPNWVDADDIMQETATTMWHKFKDFKTGSNFTAWSMSVAYYKVLSFRKKQKHNALLFDHNMIETLANHASTLTKEKNIRQEALQDCLSKLEHSDYELVRLRYEKFDTTRQLSDYIGKPVHRLYRALTRIHNMLLECIQEKLTQIT